VSTWAVLDRDPMALYRHAPNKAALLDGVTAPTCSADHDEASIVRTRRGRRRK